MPAQEKKRDHLFKPGQSGNPGGRRKGTRNLTTELYRAIKSMRVGDHKYLEVVLLKALKNPAAIVKILEKLLPDASPQIPLVVNNSLEMIVRGETATGEGPRPDLRLDRFLDISESLPLSKAEGGNGNGKDEEDS